MYLKFILICCILYIIYYVNTTFWMSVLSPSPPPKKNNYICDAEYYTCRIESRKLHLFTDAPEAFIDELAMTMTCEIYAPGKNIIEIDDDADCMYFIISGTTQVVGPTQQVTLTNYIDFIILLIVFALILNQHFL